MAETNDANDPNLTHRITPREVEPDRRSERPDADRAAADERPPRRGALRDDGSVEEAPGDRAGIAGGGIDSGVSGLGGNTKP